MDSPLKLFLKKKLTAIYPYLKKINATPNLITTYGLILNAFSILNLLNNDFSLFIALFITSYLCDLVDGGFAKKYNMETQFGAFYDRLADWIKLSTVLYAIYILYYKKITTFIILLFIVLMIFCNINYSLKMLKNKSELKLNNNISTKFTLKWIKLYEKININTREKLAKFTKYFDETMMILYLVCIIIYIHHL